MKCSKKMIFKDKDQTFNNIMSTILFVDKDTRGNLEKYINKKKGKAVLKKIKNLTPEKIHKLVHESIKFIEDIDHQFIKEPSCTIIEGFGDCKSFSLLTAHLLDIAGYESKFRLISQDDETQKHIYNVLIDGRVLDSTINKPFTEVYYTKKKDYDRY